MASRGNPKSLSVYRYILASYGISEQRLIYTQAFNCSVLQLEWEFYNHFQNAIASIGSNKHCKFSFVNII